MKIPLILIFALLATTSFAQYGKPSEGDKIARAAQIELEHQRSLYREQAAKDARANQTRLAQQAELAAIYGKDPWRHVNGTTNSTASPAWMQFQGQAQSLMPDGVVFRGKFGPVLAIHPTTFYEGGALRLLYGEDYFFVKNFPYPADARQSYQQMMGLPDGYYSYTSPSGQTLTIKSFNYGTPCAKVETAEEKTAPVRKQQAINDKILKSNQDDADRGDAYGLLRMGQRYRDGEGVPRDLVKARDYLTRAVQAGSDSAAKDLKNLPEN
jgi:hypothetical protein